MPLKRFFILLILIALLLPAAVQAKSYLIVLENRDNSLRVSGGYPSPAEAVSRIRGEFNAKVQLTAVQTDTRPNPVSKYVTSGFDLIIGAGAKVSETTYNSAFNNKYQQYALVDIWRGNIGDNAIGFAFSYAEAGYLAGFIAAKTSQTGVIGFIGGERLPQLRDFTRGYRDGAHYANPDIKIRSVYLGDFFDAYAARSKADEMYLGGADVVCQLAGPGGQGVVESAQNNGKWCINVETAKNRLPKNVLAAIVLNYDLAIYEACRIVEAKEFSGGRSQLFNMANEGIYANFASGMPAPVKKDVRQMLRDIIDGKVLVRNYDSRVIN